MGLSVKLQKAERYLETMVVLPYIVKPDEGKDYKSRYTLAQFGFKDLGPRNKRSKSRDDQFVNNFVKWFNANYWKNPMISKLVLLNVKKQKAGQAWNQDRDNKTLDQSLAKISSDEATLQGKMIKDMLKKWNSSAEKKSLPPEVK